MRTNMLVILMLLPLAPTLSAQSIVASWSNVDIIKIGRETLYKIDGVLLEGPYRLTKSNGNGAFTALQFKQGKINGRYTKYDFKGRVIQKSNYKEGRIEGKSIYYHQNGKLSKEVYFKNGEKTGTWQYYDDQGEVMAKEKYVKDKKEGKWTRTVKYPDGTKGFITENYKDDEPMGRWEERNEENRLHWKRDYIDEGSYTETKYHVNQKISEIRTLLNWKLDGEFKRFGKSGILIEKKMYQSDQLILHQTYFDNGKQESVTHYVLGKKEGVYQLFSDEGIKLCEGYYEDNLKNGLWKDFRSRDGELSTSQVYKDDERHGLFQRYNLANKLSQQGNFVNNEKDGLWNEYDLSGKLVKEIEYSLGKKISEKIIEP